MRANFADLSLDTERREVVRGDRPIALNPKAFDLLASLVASWPSAASKESLYDRLWPGVFVEMGNLHNLVSDIRLAIHDEEHTVIRTIHRFGYAIGVPVTTDSEIRAHLVIGGRELPLREGENVIGRDLVGNADVSRRHARILIAGTHATIEDLGSKNGTWIDKRRLDGPFSFTGDQEVVLGRTRALIRFASASESTMTASPL
ncbi:MAG TPA: FHA domain-containing protein [Thermoanaerobaculia bacterium]|nr:FHA domain-containing protein [Thermoanaerobaculia bacterium]